MPEPGGRGVEGWGGYLGRPASGCLERGDLPLQEKQTSRRDCECVGVSGGDRVVRSWTRDAFPGSKRTRVLSFPRHPLLHPSTSAAESVDPRPPSLPGALESRRSAQPQGGKGIPGPQERRVCRAGAVGGVPSARRVDRGSNRLEESAGAEAAVGSHLSVRPPHPPALPQIAPGRSEGVGEPHAVPAGSGAKSRRACGKRRARGCGHPMRGDLASRPGPRAEVGLSTFGPLGRSLWLLQPP